jgi:SM-20-related protein
MQSPDQGQLPFPPYAQLLDFFEGPLARALLEWVLANRDRFQASGVSGEKRLDLAVRSSLTFGDLGPYRDPIEATLRARAKHLFQAAGLKVPGGFSFELELVAHGHGAHFKPHRDIVVGPTRGPGTVDDRLLSGVYYFHREPKAFSGGELRIYRMGSIEAPGEYREVQPMQNSMVVFPPWAAHEVRPVSCPSGSFEDSRFALNCWFCKAES